MKKLLIAVLTLLVSNFISWGVFNFLLYLMCRCFGVGYSFSFGTGVYILVILIIAVIKSGVRK